MGSYWREAGPVGTAALCWGVVEKTCSFVRFANRVGGRFRSRGGRIMPSESAIVEALAEENNVGERIVNGKNDHGGEDALKDSAKDVEDISEEPDDDELDRQGVGIASLEVLDDLRGEDDDPASNRDGTANS